MKQDGRGMFISYWKDMESIRAWASHPIHEEAKTLGIARWYQSYTSMIAEVGRFHEKK
jgi:heme-degrading monooxygenase HmoA